VAVASHRPLFGVPNWITGAAGEPSQAELPCLTPDPIPMAASLVLLDLF